MASSRRAFFGGGASSELCAAKKAATAALRSPSGPACLRKASSGGVRGRGGGDGFFGWGTAADLSAADFFTRRIVREIRRGAARERSARLGDVFF